MFFPSIKEMRGLLKARMRRCGAVAYNLYCLDLQSRGRASLDSAADKAVDKGTTTLTVNGHSVEVPQGTTILEACRALKIHVSMLYITLA